MKTIGIIGGLGPESTIACYAYITRKYYELRRDYGYPDVLIHSLRFDRFIEAGYELPGTVKKAIEGLHAAGADFIVAPCNSVHIVYESVAADIPIPWISIMDATGEKIAASKIEAVALLGTVFTMSKGFYQKGLARHRVESLTPTPEQQARINHIIFDELIVNRPTRESRQYVLDVIGDLRGRGARGVVLGCTELPFLIQQAHTELPVFDTSELLAQKALDVALEGDVVSVG
jgi:aspartate racemase